MTGHTARRMATLKRRVKLCGRLALIVAVFSIARPPKVDGLKQIEANPDAKRLYDDLLSHYNRLIRPVVNNTETLTVHLGLRLTQLIEVNMKNQVMTTNLWVEQKWVDYKLRWNPEHYGGVEELYVPSEHIWLPDIVLYNNADGNYEVTLMTRATVKYTGEVYWKPPAIYKSSCKINVLYFPFDEQSCDMKFGSWTYNGFQVDLKHIDQDTGSNLVHHGINLKEFYLSVEWDILDAPARRNEEYEPSTCCANNDTTCCVPFSDITFNLTMRRKTLFYTINLIVPCVGITFLTVLVFYLPSASGEKVSLCISILLSLTVFFLLLAEIIPPTSLAVPLLGKYLLFTMVLVTLSVVVTILVLNVNFRSPVTHRMKPWVQRFFINTLPRILCITRPKKEDSGDEDETDVALTSLDVPSEIDKYVNYGGKRLSADFEIGVLPPSIQPSSRFDMDLHAALPPLPPPLPGPDDDLFSAGCGGTICGGPCGVGGDVSPAFRDMDKTVEDARFIAQHVRNKDKFENVMEDWKYVAMVLDRLFLWIFSAACISGTALIILQAPALYDYTDPIDLKYSKVAKKNMLIMSMMGPEEE